MARSSFGHVRQRQSGRWQARYQDMTGRQHSKTFRTKAEAAAWLRDESKTRDEGKWVDPRAGKVRFSEWAKQWETAGVVNLRASTARRDVEYLNRYIVPTFGRWDLADIDYPAVARWVVELSKRLKPSTVHKATQIFSKVIASAAAAKRVPVNPVEGVPLPKIEEEEMRFLEPGDVDRLSTVIDARWRALPYVGAYGGLRGGELFALRVGRVLPGGWLDVVESVDDNLDIGPLKTRAARRRVQLPPTVAGMLAEHVAGKSADRFVFEAPHGGPVRRRSWESRFWRPAVASCGLDGLRLHDLRHTAVAFWIAAGASPLEVARRAGHRSVKTVLDRYGHLLPGTEEKVTSALERLLAGPSTSSPVGCDLPGVSDQAV